MPIETIEKLEYTLAKVMLDSRPAAWNNTPVIIRKATEINHPKVIW